jgi:hypothetical protein
MLWISYSANTRHCCKTFIKSKIIFYTVGAMTCYTSKILIDKQFLLFGIVIIYANLFICMIILEKVIMLINNLA